LPHRLIIHKRIQFGGKVGYTATDSVYTDLPLPPTAEAFKDFVGNELGQFKLERSFEFGVWARGGGLCEAKLPTGNKAWIKRSAEHWPNRDDITFEEIYDLAARSAAVFRVAQRRRQRSVVDTGRVAPVGGYAWAVKNITFTNRINKIQPIEYGGLRLGLISKFFMFGIEVPRISYQLWRNIHPLPMLPAPGIILDQTPRIPCSPIKNSYYDLILEEKQFNKPAPQILAETPNDRAAIYGAMADRSVLPNYSHCCLPTQRIPQGYLA
jgi:hypothetical protein